MLAKRMDDKLDATSRSRNMSAIRSRDTKPEIALRSALHAKGFRFRLYDKRLAGRPDLVLPKYGAVVFVHGCFWHQHDGCRYAATPKTRTEFWQQKFNRNLIRDRLVSSELLATGWRVAVIWECALRGCRISDTAADLAKWLRTESIHFETTPYPPI